MFFVCVCVAFYLIHKQKFYPPKIGTNVKIRNLTGQIESDDHPLCPWWVYNVNWNILRYWITAEEGQWMVLVSLVKKWQGQTAMCGMIVPAAQLQFKDKAIVPLSEMLCTIRPPIQLFNWMKDKYQWPMTLKLQVNKHYLKMAVAPEGVQQGSAQVATGSEQMATGSAQMATGSAQMVTGSVTNDDANSNGASSKESSTDSKASDAAHQ